MRSSLLRREGVLEREAAKVALILIIRFFKNLPDFKLLWLLLIVCTNDSTAYCNQELLRKPPSD